MEQYKIEMEDLRKTFLQYEHKIRNGCIVSITNHVLDGIINCGIHSSHTPTEEQVNVQQLGQMLKWIVYLKLINDVVKVERTVDISELEHLQTLDIEKVDISKITGLKWLRSHLKELICVKNGIESLKSVLEDCGGDFSSKYIWAELKNLVVTHNDLISLDDSLECTPWLTNLDLSHNNITSAVEVSCLVNLKSLNLSYNKLKNLPKFTGQVCNRLQILNVSNNFLEDIAELKSLLKITELDLSNNCLIDHSALAPLSHLSTLEWLTLFGNPLFYHPQHSKNTSGFLHLNIEKQRFILDYKKLTPSDVKAVGLHFRPWMASESLISSSENLLVTSTSERGIRRIREVDIEDNLSAVQAPVELPNSYSSIDHLKVKNEVKALREVYGASWLNHYKTLDNKDSVNTSQDISGFEVADEKSDNENNSEIIQEPEPDNENGNEPDFEESSVEDDIEVNSEETMYLAKVEGETDELFLVFTKDTLKEIECTTSKERSTWMLDTISGYEVIDENLHTVKIAFHTLKKDKKLRVYVMLEDNVDEFCTFIQKILDGRNHRQIIYHCFKCLEKFYKNDDCLVASYNVKDDQNCPFCGSNIIVKEESDAA